MILTHDVIIAEIEAGNIRITPYDEKMVGPASVDLHLGDELRIPDGGREVIDVSDGTDIKGFSTLCRLDGGYELAAGATALGITREHIALAPDICGRLEGRSRFARLGLMVHVTAGFVSPGVENRQVLEISNLSTRTLRLHAGSSICQIIFERAEGSAVYGGRFADQEEL